jgi:hypothetical protein
VRHGDGARPEREGRRRAHAGDRRRARTKRHEQPVEAGREGERPEPARHDGEHRDADRDRDGPAHAHEQWRELALDHDGAEGRGCEQPEELRRDTSATGRDDARHDRDRSHDRRAGHVLRERPEAPARLEHGARGERGRDPDREAPADGLGRVDRTIATRLHHRDSSRRR